MNWIYPEWISNQNRQLTECPYDFYRNAVFWLYSMTDKTYNLALQIELHCWKQIQAAFDSDRCLEPSQQDSKRQLRESIIKTIDLLEPSMCWVHSINSTYFFTPTELKARVEVTLKAKRALAAEIQRSIDDYQGEAEMKLIRAKLRRMMTPPSSPIAKPQGNEKSESIMEMLEKTDLNTERKFSTDMA